MRAGELADEYEQACKQDLELDPKWESAGSKDSESAPKHQERINSIHGNTAVTTAE